jgi:hypothetical protein
MNLKSHKMTPQQELRERFENLTKCRANAETYISTPYVTWLESLVINQSSPVPGNGEVMIVVNGKDFLGMPVANKSLLIPTIELRIFAKEILRKNGVILPTLELNKLYTDYVREVVKPKYEKKRNKMIYKVERFDKNGKQYFTEDLI